MLVIQSKNLTITEKISEIENRITTDHDHSKYIATQEVKLTSENFTARLAQANLVSKNDSNFVKKTDFHNKLNYY